MFSRIYILVFFLLLYSLWFGKGAEYDLSSKLVLSGVYMGYMVPMMWIDTILMMGLRTLRSIPVYVKLFFRSKRGATLTGIIVLLLTFLWSPFAETPSPHRTTMSISVVTAVIFLWIQPAYFLFLGESNPPSGMALQKISASFFPRRTVAMLDREEILALFQD